MKEFTWKPGDPIHREDKIGIPGVKPAFEGECLDEQVERIVGDISLEELLSRLPGSIPFSETSEMRLKIQKGSEFDFVAGYYIFKDPGSSNFNEVPVECEAKPDLRLTLFLLLQKINKTLKGSGKEI